MDKFNEKLNAFTSLVLNDADTKRSDLLEKVQKKHDTMINAKENEFLEEAYESIQHSIADAKKAANEKVLRVEIDAKKQLLLARENIINEVMEDVKNKLAEFTKTKEYENWLITKTQKAIFEVGKGSKVIYISSDDLRYKTKLESIDCDGHISVEAAAEKDFMGGVKVFNPDRKVGVDYSFKEMLAEEKKEFLQKSGLTID